MGLISLTYVSASAHVMSENELMDILEVSRKNNAPLNITGMLLYRNGYFIQALEGDEEAVMGLYDKIAHDPRHHHVLLVHKEEITERSFSDWSMGFRNLDQMDPSELEGYTDYLEQSFSSDFYTKNPSRAKTFLRLFKNNAI